MIKNIHFHLKPLERTKAPLMSRIAYRNAQKVECERTGLVFDYSNKKGVLNQDQRVYLPGGKTEDRLKFWTRADLHDRHPSSVTAREAVADLPHILNDRQRFEICEKFAQAVAQKYGVACDFSLHAPHIVTDYMLEKDPQQFHIIDPFRNNERNNGNYHVHILLSTSTVDPETGKLGKKNRELDPIACARDKKENSATWARPVWAAIVNEALEKAGFDERVEHESFEKLGLDQTPTEHAGPAAVNRRRQGKESYKLDALRERAIAAAEEKIKLAEQFASLQAEIERTQQQLAHLQNLLRKQEQDPAKILESWTPRQKILDAVEKLEKRKQRQEGWFDYTRFSVTENISIASILVHRLLVWLGLGGMPDVVNAMLKLADAEEQVQNTQQQYQRKTAQLDKLQSTALVTIVRNQKKARAGLKLRMKRARTLNEKYAEQLQSAEELMNVTEQLLASLQQSIDEIATAPMTSAPVPVNEKKKNPRRRRIEVEEDDTTTGASGKSGGMSSMPAAAIKQRISHLRSLRPDLLFKAQLRSQGSFNLQEEREAQVQSLNSLSMEVEGLQTRLAELTQTSTVIGKLLRPIFDRTEEKQVSELLSQRRSELVAAKAELVKIEKEYRMAWTRFQAQHGERWHQKLKPELDALVKLLPVAEAREASEQKAKIQREALQEQLKREAYLRQQKKPQSVALKKQTIEDHLAAEAATRRPEAPTPKSYPRPKF